MLHLFGHKILIQLKGFIYYWKIPQNNVLLEHTGPLCKVFKILKSFDKTAFENSIFVSKSLKGLLLPIFSSWFNFLFSHTLIIIDGQILGTIEILVVINCSHQLRASNLKEISITFFLTELPHVFPNRTSTCVYKLRINLLWSLFRTFPLIFRIFPLS